MATPVDVGTSLQGVMILELIGPIGPLGSYEELLTLIPSRWCVTESLVLTDIDDPQRAIGPAATNSIWQQSR